MQQNESTPIVPGAAGFDNDFEHIDFKSSLLDFVRAVSIYLEEAFFPIVDRYGLTLLQVRILNQLRKEDHTIGSLASMFSIAESNASSMCKKLEKAGYLKRVRDENDERCVKLRVTQQCLDTIDNIEYDLEERIGAFLSGKTKTEMYGIINSMQEVLKFTEELHTASMKK